MLASELLEQFGSAGNLSAPPGSLPWAIAVRGEMQSEIHDLRFKAEQLKVWRNLMKDKEGWKQLKNKHGQTINSYHELCAYSPPTGLGMSASKIDAIIELILGE